MKIVISGGLGYVGGRLAQYFAGKGHEVLALSRKASTLEGVNFPPQITVLHPDEVLHSSSGLAGADIFIHLAALNEIDCVKQPYHAIEVNISHTLQWLDAAYLQGVKRFIYFSTAHVYGKPLQGFYNEESLAVPVHPYAITHRCAEDYVVAYAREKEMENIIIRLTNSFGGPAFPTADRWTLLVNDLCRSAANNGKMILLSDGLQLRDFVCLHDVCTGVDHLINITHEPTKSIIYNLGAGYSISVCDMALKVKAVAEKVLQKEVLLERKELPATTTKDSLTISIDKLLQTGFQLRNNIEEEITSTLSYFNNFS
ncbi:NAD-dependent epimerase/dehydratase family protein [Chryseosolibacter indicus]|uniref:SDR family oxidoreductase n=1 Tax=Chryseosolibacter indicus TaxID=2782351 RepID=A0ABS5VY07_9BACT|nr:SDR family oxidoreductase [Chryseosolibacter indicus]MBT1704881.1 SDR family oxidoreductase [Chryseosolibacter indicus]